MTQRTTSESAVVKPELLAHVQGKHREVPDSECAACQRTTSVLPDAEQRKVILEALSDGPKSSRELGVDVATLRSMESYGFIDIDPDRFPGEYVPFNPLVARLPGDDRTWVGWSNWNV